MRTLSVPVHFTTTFLVAIGAYAGVWLALSRSPFAPPGWARWVFGLGWLALGTAETVHGAQIVMTDVGGLLLGLRIGAYLLILASLVSTIPGLPGIGPPGGTGTPIPAWRPTPRNVAAVMVAGVARTAGPAVAGLGAALAALASRLEGARRLALALGLLGAAEVFLAHGGAVTDTPGVTWYAGHGLQLAGGLALGVWLWQAVRVSLQARFVAALVLLVIMVISLISFTFTQFFNNNVRTDAFNSLEAAAIFENSQISARASAYGLIAQVLSASQPIPALAAARSSDVLQPLLAQYRTLLLPGADFLAVFAADGSYLAYSGRPGTRGVAPLNDAEVVSLAGSSEVRAALEATVSSSTDDLGIGHPKLVLIGAAPVRNATGTKPVGVVAVGQLVNEGVLNSIPLARQQSAAILDSVGGVLATQLPGIDTLIGPELHAIQAHVGAPGSGYKFQGSIGATPYFAFAAPLERPSVGRLLVVQGGVESFEVEVSRYLFLGALAATIFAVGASMISGFRMTRPIRDLTDAAGRVSMGDLSARVVVVESDEVGALATAFNQMTASLDEQAADLRVAAIKEASLRGELETILQSMTDGLIAVDRQCRIVTINREAERITGVSAERARGKLVADVLMVVDASGSRIELPVYSLARGSTSGFTPAQTAGGTGLPVAVTSAPIIDKDAAVTGAVAVVRDLTPELEVEQMKTEFLSNISHELRTPLTPIKGYADLLRRRPVSREKELTFLSAIASSTERLERIVDMLVDFSAMQAGRLMVRVGRLDLDPATEALVTKWQESAPTHTFERAGFAGLPDVWGDPRLLPRAIEELLDNAVKFSPRGGVVRVEGCIEAEEPTMVRVSVEDHGIGISEEQRDRIFQDFVQVDASETRAFGGLGLGLAYVRRIIEAHGGRLEVESREGKGSRFSLLIRIWREPLAGPGRPDEEPPGAPVPVSPLRAGGRPGGISRRPPPESPRSR